MFYVPATSADSWRVGLAEAKHWKAGRSAHALAHTWHGTGFPPAISELFREAELSELHGLEMLVGLVEHKVPLDGRGRASQTDLFVLARTVAGEQVAIAVEGKVDEPFGQRVRDWLGTDEEATNKPARLDFLCQTLGLDRAAAAGISYQLLHRTASAILEAQRFGARYALMIVHSFCPDSSGFADFKQFGKLMGVSEVEKATLLRCRLRDPKLSIAWVADELPPEEEASAS